jgi:HEAT repeat protein
MVLSLIACAPNFAGLVAARRDGPSGGWVQIDSPAVPIRVEALRGTDLRAFNATLGYLRARLEPGEPLFAFPALSLFAFALGHPTPAPHDYFFPGRPDHLAEAEILRDVDAARPRFVVTLNRRLGFFSEAPAYYFLVRAYLRTHYELAARFGRYDVLRRRGTGTEAVQVETFEPPPLPAAGDLAAGLADPDREQRRSATLAWLDEVAGRPPASVIPADDATGLLLMRNLAEVADPRGLPIAYAVYETASWRLKNEAAGALNFLALRDVLGRHLIAPDVAAAARQVPAGLAAIDPAPLRRTLEDQKKRLETGAFSSWALRTLGTPSAESSFEVMLRDEPKRPYFRVEAAKGLVALGRGEYVCTLVHLLRLRKHEVQNTVPSFLIETAATRAEAVTRCLGEGLRAASVLERETSAWIAGAAGLGAMQPALRRALADDEAIVRSAAAWALGQLGDPSARPALAALADDEDRHVRGFAGEALAHLEGGGG